MWLSVTVSAQKKNHQIHRILPIWTNPKFSGQVGSEAKIWSKKISGQ
jgi:hypothetical protein